MFDRNDDEYSSLLEGVVDVNAFSRVYIPLNHYYNTMNFAERPERKIRQDFVFQVLLENLFYLVL